MRLLPNMQKIWQSGDLSGSNSPMARATIQHPFQQLHNYSLTSTFTENVGSQTGVGTTLSNSAIEFDTKHGFKVDETYASYMFEPSTPPVELAGIQSVSWTRSVDTDTATMTMVLSNTSPLINIVKAIPGKVDYPGYYSPFYGESKNYASKWGQAKNSWNRVLMPDNVIRTYEGYGVDWSKTPENDANLAQTGVWIIDTVQYDALGTITITGRDLARLLLENMLVKPIVPNSFYPLSFQNWTGQVYVGDKQPNKPAVHPVTTWATSQQKGHEAQKGNDYNTGTYWLSKYSKSPNSPNSEIWYGEFSSPSTITEIRINMLKAGFHVYVGFVDAEDNIAGNKEVQLGKEQLYPNGYLTDDAGNMFYYRAAKVNTTGVQTITFPEITNILYVYIIFTNLQSFGKNQYAAALQEVECYGVSPTPIPQYGTLTPGPEGANPGFYSDYTNIVMLLAAWSGFYCPKTAWSLDCGNKKTMITAPYDNSSVLGAGVQGVVWGDFTLSGTSGPLALEADIFDKKSAMEAINYIKSILGFYFCVDETGAIQWRLPNMFSTGNWVVNDPNPTRTTLILKVDESTVLTSCEVNLSSANVREKNIVSDSAGNYASTAPGYNPNPTGLRRLGMWTDQNFASTAETSTMASMISVRQMDTYRTVKWTIPGFPGIQVDDQIMIADSTTAEDSLHYIRSISSSWSSDGDYSYTIESSWLGSVSPTRFKASSNTNARAIADAYVETLSARNPDFLRRKAS